ncbi:ferredoxin [Clostridium cylindrosporum]|uniref:Ferredoxin n=1 Tax=Clostridium cylindrosporum DSM 605 TaxID=1121307 RepID=A0A0J8DFF5_CLOCY|nr:ferredoxin [Clostridium cylindrosporum]KMT22913.1 ferredoxin [Clostridium cylindrosporum DSM 605]
MKASVNEDLCIGCGLCPSIAPQVFALNDNGKAEAIVEEVPGDYEDEAAEARSSCPVDAIDVH